jgi:hypothetical protein
MRQDRCEELHSIAIEVVSCTSLGLSSLKTVDVKWAGCGLPALVKRAEDAENSGLLYMSQGAGGKEVTPNMSHAL